MVIGNRVGERMAALGLSQAELARRVGVAQPTIYKLVRANKIGSKYLHVIARELGTTPAYLSGETDDPDADAPDAPALDAQERDLIGMFSALPAPDRAALMHIVRVMVRPQTTAGVA